MNDYDKIGELLYLDYWDINSFYRWAMPQKLSVGGFKWIEHTSQFSKDFIENYTEDSDEGYFFEVDVQYTEKCITLRMIYP